MAVFLVKKIDDGNTLVARYHSQILVFRMEETTLSRTQGLIMIGYLESTGIIHVALSVGSQYSHPLAIGRKSHILHFCILLQQGSSASCLNVHHLHIIVLRQCYIVIVGAGRHSIGLHGSIEGCHFNIRLGITSHQEQILGISRIANRQRLIFAIGNLSQFILRLPQIVDKDRVLTFFAIQDGIRGTRRIYLQGKDICSRGHIETTHRINLATIIIIKSRLIII